MRSLIRLNIRGFTRTRNHLSIFTEKKLVLLSDRAIAEDPLRILRAFRYKATLSFEFSEELKEEIFKKRELLKTVSRERILMEMEEILLGEEASQALLMMAELHILDVIFPEMEALRNLQQGENHIRDAFEHSVWVTILALKLAKEGKVIRFFARSQGFISNRMERLISRLR